MKANDQIVSFSVKPDDVLNSITIPRKTVSRTEWPASWWPHTGMVVKELFGQGHKDIECLVVDHGQTAWGFPTEQGRANPVNGQVIVAIIQPARDFTNVTKVKRDGTTWTPAQWVADYDRNIIYITESCSHPYDRKWQCDLDGLEANWSPGLVPVWPGDVIRELLTGEWFGTRPSSEIDIPGFDRLNGQVPVHLSAHIDRKMSLGEALTRFCVSANVTYRRELDGIIHPVDLWDNNIDAGTIFLEGDELDGWFEWYDYSGLSETNEFEFMAYDQTGEEPDEQTTRFRTQTIWAWQMFDRMKVSNPQKIQLWTRYWLTTPPAGALGANHVAWQYVLDSAVRPVHYVKFRTRERDLELLVASKIVINRTPTPQHGRPTTLGGIAPGASHVNSLWRVLTAGDRAPNPAGCQVIAKKLRDLEPWEIPANA